MKKAKKILSLLLALVMVLSLAACGGNNDNKGSNNQGSSDNPPAAADPTTPTDTGDKDNGDGSFYNEALGYTYGSTFRSDEPITYTMFFNDNDAYPIKDTWQTEGVFKKIEEITNVKLDITIVNNASYGEKVNLAISSGTAPYIIPKIYSEAPYVNGGGIVAVSDYIQYMPNYLYMLNTYELQPEVDTLKQEDGKYYRLPGLKEAALQDYTLNIRDDIFKAAGYDVRTLEDDWTWEEFADILIGVKQYMVDNGMCGPDDYIWSDRWCGATSGYGTGGNLLNLISKSYGIHTSWNSGPLTNYGDLYFDWDADEFKVSSTSEQYKQYMTVVQKLVKEKILDPETWTQDDDVADGKFYRGETALISTNRAQFAVQVNGVASQLGEGNFECYEVVLPMGTTSWQAENLRLECGVCVSSGALKDLGEDEFIKLMRFVDWLWYSDEGLMLTKWGVEGETYQVNSDGSISLMPGYYCNGLSIPQSSDDQVDMRMEYGYACGNFMYPGSRELLTSNFSPEIRDFYDRMAKYRTLRPVDPAIALSEDDAEQINLWATPLKSEMCTWTLRFAMGQADIEADWDAYVAAIEGQNVQAVVDMYNTYYQNSK